MIGFSLKKIDFDTLRCTVEKKLCEIGNLEPHQFPMTGREVVKGGKACGFYFCVHGPRSVKLTAVCDLTKKTVVYYGSDGARRESAKLPIRSDVTRQAKAGKGQPDAA